MIASILRFYDLGAEPLWVDEAFTWRWSQLSHAALWGSAAPFEYNPPLYFSLQRVWLVLGSSEFALRSLPALLGILTCLVVYRLGLTLADRRTAELASLMAATHAVLIAYSQEARGYALLTFLVILAAWSGIEAIKSMQLRSAKGSGYLALYVLTASGALYTHHVAAFFILLMNLGVLGFLLMTSRSDVASMVSWLAANFVIGVAWSWWLPIILMQTEDRVAIDWIKQPSLLFAAFSWVRIYSELYIEFAGKWGQVMVPLVLFSVAGSWWIVRRRSWTWLPIVVVFVGWPILLWLPGLIGGSIWVERALVPSVPFGLLLMAYGVAQLPSPLGRRVLASAVLLVQLINLVAYYEKETKAPWDDLVATIAAHSSRNSAFVVVGDYYHGPFGYYADRAGLAERDFVIQLGEGLPDKFPDLQDYRRNYQRLTKSDLKNGVIAFDEIWLVWRERNRVPPLASFIDLLADYGQPDQSWEFAPGLHLVRVQRADTMSKTLAG